MPEDGGSQLWHHRRGRHRQQQQQQQRADRSDSLASSRRSVSASAASASARTVDSFMDEIHSKQSHFFNSLFPSRANR